MHVSSLDKPARASYTRSAGDNSARIIFDFIFFKKKEKKKPPSPAARGAVSSAGGRAGGYWRS